MILVDWSEEWKREGGLPRQLVRMTDRLGPGERLTMLLCCLCLQFVGYCSTERLVQTRVTRDLLRIKREDGGEVQVDR